MPDAEKPKHFITDPARAASLGRLDGKLSVTEIERPGSKGPPDRYNDLHPDVLDAYWDARSAERDRVSALYADAPYGPSPWELHEADRINRERAERVRDAEARGDSLPRV